MKRFNVFAIVMTVFGLTFVSCIPLTGKSGEGDNKTSTNDNGLSVFNEKNGWVTYKKSEGRYGDVYFIMPKIYDDTERINVIPGSSQYSLGYWGGEYKTVKWVDGKANGDEGYSVYVYNTIGDSFIIEEQYNEVVIKYAETYGIHEPNPDYSKVPDEGYEVVIKDKNYKVTKNK